MDPRKHMPRSELLREARAALKETISSDEERPNSPLCQDCGTMQLAAASMDMAQRRSAAVFALTGLMILVEEFWRLDTFNVSDKNSLKQNLYKELGEREKQISALFHDFIKAGEFSLLYGLLRTLHDPELFK